MTNQVKPGRPPAHDLAAFDLTKRSPEQLAQSFAHWRAQRKRSLEEPNRPLQSQSSAAVAKDAAPASAPADEAAKPELSKRAKSVEYSATFSELLAAGSEPTVQPADRPAIVARPSLKRVSSPGRRLRAMSVLAGAASFLALGGGMVLELSNWPRSVEAETEVAQTQLQQVPAPIVAAATSAPETEWKLQRIVDVALMKAAPSVRAKPNPPTIHTASRAATVESKPTKPTPEEDTPKIEFVAKPFVPAPASTPAAQGTATPAPSVAAALTGDPRPDALPQYNRIKRNSTNGVVSNRVESGDKPAKATGSKSAVESTSTTARAATARSRPAASAATGDPRGESSGGARPGIGGAAGGTDTNDATDADGGNSGAADGGSASGGAGSSDAVSDSTGGNGAGSGDAGSGEGDPGASDGEVGDSGGIDGAIGGALDGVGDVLGGALGGGNSTPDSGD